MKCSLQQQAVTCNLEREHSVKINVYQVDAFANKHFESNMAGNLPAREVAT
tara:strand:+ start:212 stop:364 length:153 start_codon:yes stop_codon:yes gene_type:complete